MNGISDQGITRPKLNFRNNFSISRSYWFYPGFMDHYMTYHSRCGIDFDIGLPVIAFGRGLWLHPYFRCFIQNQYERGAGFGIANRYSGCIHCDRQHRKCNGNSGMKRGLHDARVTAGRFLARYNLLKRVCGFHNLPCKCRLRKKHTCGRD